MSVLGAVLVVGLSLSVVRSTWVSTEDVPGARVVHVATTGSDLAATGDEGSPFASLGAAVAAARPGDRIEVHGGTYRITGPIVLDRAGVSISASPGERPVFDGSVAAGQVTSADGETVTLAYQPVPAAPGEGLTPRDLPAARFEDARPVGLAAARGWRCVFEDASYTEPDRAGGGSGGCPPSSRPTVLTGYYPDQVWVGPRSLTQVLDVDLVGPGMFYVERTSGTDGSPPLGRLVLHAADAVDLTQVRVSGSSGTFLSVRADSVEISGVAITRHSPDWSHRAIDVTHGASGTLLRDVAIHSTSSVAVKLGDSWSSGHPQVRGTTIDRLWVDRSGWSALVALYTDDTTIHRSAFRSSDPDSEFQDAPQRGAIKATKNHRMAITDSSFDRNSSFGVWWDQSNYDATLANTTFTGNGESAVFFEISHGLTMVNNLVLARGSGPAVRLAGSSGLKLVNNTIVGGKGTVAVLTDARSKDFSPGRPCAEHPARYGQPGDLASCWIQYRSDLDLARPGAFGGAGVDNLTPDLTWKPAVDMLVNNVLAEPRPAGFCAAPVPLCVRSYTRWTGELVSVPMDSILSSGSQMDGNVYQASAGIARFRAPEGQPGDFFARSLPELRGDGGLGGVPFGLDVEEHGMTGRGWVTSEGEPTSELRAVQGRAAPVPVDPVVNEYVAAQSRQYGWTQPRAVEP